MSDFDGPLVAGTVVGVRAFKVRRHRVHTFVPLTNSFEVTESPVLESPMHSDTQFSAEEQPWAADCGYISTHVRHCRTDAWPCGHREAHTHRVGQPGCSCGFYAWFKRDRPVHDDSASTITAIVEGFGVCTVGDRGFRAEKMRLLGLVAPNCCLPQMDRTSDWMRHHRVGGLLVLFLFIAMVVTGVMILLGSPFPWAMLSLVPMILGLCGVLVTFTLDDHGRKRRNGPRADCSDGNGWIYDAAEVAQRYAVPLYGSLGQAIKAHPPTRVRDLPKALPQVKT